MARPIKTKHKEKGGRPGRSPLPRKSEEKEKEKRKREREKEGSVV